jgi:alpha-1,3-glucan synthase
MITMVPSHKSTFSLTQSLALSHYTMPNSREFWAMHTQEEVAEVCKVFNIPVETANEYVQFGDVFNLQHAGASYLRIHQKGFGAVGVGKKYGKRSWARYPIFWGLEKIG